MKNRLLQYRQYDGRRISVSKVIWVVFWAVAAVITASVLAFRAMQWKIDQDLKAKATAASYVRYSNDSLAVGQPDLYTITSYGEVRLQLTASDAFLQWGESPVRLN